MSVINHTGCTTYLWEDVGLCARVRDVSRRVELLGRAEHVPRRHPQFPGAKLLQLHGVHGHGPPLVLGLAPALLDARRGGLQADVVVDLLWSIGNSVMSWS